MANGMRSWAILLLPLCSYSWWCETSNRTGCRGQLRHFVREASASNPFLAYTDIKTSPIDDPIVVDWDLDGVLEVILRTEKGLLLFDFKEGNHFVQMEPSGFESIPPLKEYCRPAAVDWNQDEKPDLVIGAKDGIQYYERIFGGALQQRTGEDNPFRHIKTKGDFCSDLSFADWDGDGDWDLLVSDLFLPMQYFENDGDGRLSPVDEERNPFRHILQNTTGRRPLMVDWNGDKRMDLLLLPKIWNRLEHADNFIGHKDEFCFVDLYEQSDSGELLLSSDPLLRNKGCSNFTGSGVSLADLDHDGDLDVVFGAFGAPLHVFERTPSGWRAPSAVNSSSIPLDMIELDIDSSGENYLHPSLVDWDLDGDLDLALLHDSPLSQRHRYFEHQSDGTVKEINSTTLSSSTSLVSCPIDWTVQVSFTDFDLDGKKDLIGFHSTGIVLICKQTSSGFDLVPADMNPFYSGPKRSECFLEQQRPLPLGQRVFVWPISLGRISFFRGLGFGWRHGHAQNQWPQPGVCEDDVNARAKQSASGSKAISATGSGSCTCSEPFYGEGCEHGGCPPGQRLDRDAEVDNRSEKYPKWEACVPCQSGKFKNYSGTEDCSTCPGGYVPVNGTSCFPCENGKFPSPDHNNEICVSCVTGSVAIAGSPSCTACEAGFEPNEDKSLCIPCPTGWYAGPRSAKCNPCGEGSVPEPGKSSCKMCTGQMYAQPGDEVCRKCTFPSMILGEDNRCTPLYTALFLLAFFLLLFFVLAVFGRLRLHCLKRHLNKLVAGKDWEELHSTQATLFEFGLWKHQACKEVTACKQKVKSQSFQLGISLQYVFERLEDVYKDIAQKAEWRLDEWGPVTNSGYLVKARNCGLQLLDAVAAWDALPTCEYPKNPNFHQVAGLLAYGPLALGKHLCCPRDGQPDCSIVDALQAESSSAKATWFLSWVWGYSFSTVYKALTRWWERHRIISGASLEDGIYMWWCVFVNNQFRMLEAGLVEEPGDLFDVFGQQLEGIGKMLMCLDSMSSGQYTSRIWCIFEVFVACQRSIPTTVILPELEVGAVASVKDLTRECKVDAEQAKASVQKDADAIKKHIKEKHQSFEYVNRTVEHALWCEVIEYLERSESAQPSHESTSTGPATTLTESDVSMEKSEMPSAHTGKCILQ